MGPPCALFGEEHLRPVIAAGHIADADMGVTGIENVCPVAAGVHPAVDHGLGDCVALGDVLTGTFEEMPKFRIIWKGVP